MKEKLLIISDSNHTRDETTNSRTIAEGFEVTIFYDHFDVLAVMELKPDAIILNELSPDNSFKICSRLRQAVNVPIVILGKAPCATAVPKAVKSGADLYLLNPIRPPVLVARLKAILRRIKWNRGEELNNKEKETW